MTNDPLNHARQTTRRYWYVDGLVELTGGTILLLEAIFFVSVYLFHGNASNAFAFGPLIALGVAVLARKVVTALKERVTYPRTGYVAYRQSNWLIKLVPGLLILALGLGAALIVILLSRQVNASWIPVIAASPIALVVIYLGMRFGLLRMYLLAAFTFLIGVLTVWLNLPDLLSSAFFIGLVGLAWMISGGFTLQIYLRHTSHLGQEG
jgi:hypothetical protein